MFQSILSKAIALLNVFALVSMVSGVANAQSGTTGGSVSLGRSVLQNSLLSELFNAGAGTTQFNGGSGTTQFNGGPGTTQFNGGSGTSQFTGGSGSTQLNSGSGSTQFNGGPAAAQYGGAPSNFQAAPAQGCSSCGQPAAPAEPQFDCSRCGLPAPPVTNNCGGFQYPRLQPTGLRGIMQNCPRRGCR